MKQSTHHSLSRVMRTDLPASLVVFFVALPLCLGIALASGAPLFSGIIAGIIGGIIVGALSGSPLGVSGPAAGLAVIILGYITALGGSWEGFLTAVVLMGIVQFLLGALKLGSIAYYFPSSVIKGMLAGIGVLIVIKQVSHVFGYYGDFSTDFAIASSQNIDYYSSLFSKEAIIISIISMAILIAWEFEEIKKFKICKIIPGPLLVVIVGIISNSFFSYDANQIVSIPAPSNLGEFFSQFSTPDFSQLKNPNIYVIALVLAIVASLETLLCVEAADKLDPYRRITPTNRELKAQGVGNIVSGLIGGLPITQVIVRSSANINFGARTKISTILHGVLLLVSAIAIPNLINKVPLASLACILILVGYKLASPTIFKKSYKLGFEQFLPFIITIIGMVAFDLLKGVGLGMAASICFILYRNFMNSHHQFIDKEKGNHSHVITLAEEVNFLNKGSIIDTLRNIPKNCEVTIDGTKTKFIDYDIMEIIKDFKINARSKRVRLKIKGINLKNI